MLLMEGYILKKEKKLSIEEGSVSVRVSVCDRSML